MLKAELKTYWGSYCDTDKLVDDIMALLTKYNHDNTEEGVCSILDTYFINKIPLIEMLKKSDKYIGNMRICLDVELERKNDNSELVSFLSAFPENVEAKKAILKYVDEYGKTLDDYVRTGVKRFKARALRYNSDIATKLSACHTNRDNFGCDGATKKSLGEFDNFLNIKNVFKRNAGSTITEETIGRLSVYRINARFAEGMKTSRAFNRVCSCYGVDKLPNYNRLFAQYSDMVSGLRRKVKFYISVNPLDYLTMSFGRSWSSCHTIDKENARGMGSGYHGAHCGGTMSYMLDKTSIITYVHDHATEDHEEGKIYRNMFHYNDGTLIQGRVYPQGNDGATDLYTEFRSIMQDELTKLMGLSANDWLRRTCDCGGNTESYGVHYADYLRFDGCNVTYPREMPSAARNVVVIGHNRICPYCGREVSDSEDAGYLVHEDCDKMEDVDWD